MVFTRGRSAAKRLKIDWDVPVLPVKKGNKTAAASTLSCAEAVRLLGAKDKRPLLIMRECHQCKGSDLALLRRAGSNERTQLLTRWFHCVRLPPAVRKMGHPTHSLFAGKDAPHLLFATRDGSQILALEGNLPTSAVWKSMTKILRASYKSDPSAAVKKLVRILDTLDKLDAEQMALRTQLEKAVESSGPKSARFKKLAAKIKASQAKRMKLLGREQKLLDLGLK